jgi:hypothetical protein
MGASQTKSDVLQKVLNQTTIDVMTKNSTGESGQIESTNDVTIVASKNVSLTGIKQVNAAKINVTALQASVQQGILKSDLSAALSSAVKQQGTSLGYSASDAKVKTIVENRVSANITTENLQEIRGTVSQSNVVKVLASENIDATVVVQKNEAELILKLVSNLTSDIINDLKTTGTVQTDLSQTTASLMSGYVAIIIIIGVVLIGGAYYFKDSYVSTLKQITKPAPIILIGCVLVFLFIVAPMIKK